MSGRAVTKGTANVSSVIRIVDSTDGTPETGVTSATSGLDLKYRREGAAAVDLTESDLSALTDAHSDGGMLHIGAGYYRIDVPDAAFATGADGVLIFGAATGMVVIGTYHPLTDVDLYDAVRGGMTALPNAAADAAGGLPVSDAGGLDLDAMNTNINDIETDTADMQPKLGAPAGADMSADIAAVKAETALIVADTGELQTDWANGGRLDLLIDAIKAVTDALPDSGALSTIDGNVDAIKVVTDALTSASAALLALSAGTIVTGTISTSTTSPTTTVFAADDITEATADHFNGRVIIFTSGALADQAKDITDYELASGEGKFTCTAFTEAPANNDTFIIV